MENTEKSIQLGQMDIEEAKREMGRTVSGPMDLPYMLLVVLLSGIGLVMMFSASYAWGAARPELGPVFYVTRQGIFLVMGLVVMLAVSRFNCNYFRPFSVPLMVAAVVLLIVVLFVGSKDKGAVRWIHLGLFNIQPSEIAKVAVIMLFATMISSRPERLSQTRLAPSLIGIAPYILILIAIAGLMALQPHFSGIILILSVGGVMLYMGGLAYRWISVVFFAGAGGMAIMITATQYAANRIAIWRDPWLDPQDLGYQTIQSLYAVASGGWFGLGLGQSRQKYSYLPEPHNDFVFAIVVEELGLIGALIVLFLFMLLIVRGFWIALHARDTFGRLLVSGITALLAIQVFLNVAVVTNLIPVTGIAMPFFSYGGSSLLIMMAQMGIVLSVSRQMPAYQQGG